jgi:aminomethyltransferase
MKTSLFDRHLLLDAKMVSFAGWEMPIQYKGIIEEHQAVRNSVGIFDVSHMGRIVIEGNDAENFIDFISTNKIIGKVNCSATYTVWCQEDGGSVDDVIVYKKNEQSYFVIVNASNRSKDLEHLKKYAVNFDVIVTPCFEDGILAIQGPLTETVFKKIFPKTTFPKKMHFIEVDLGHEKIIITGTGYTGSGGFEIYASKEMIGNLWDQFLEIGVEPVGLGARDTLRLEKGYALYGHELSENIPPTESISAWAVNFAKGQFLGKEALLKRGKKHFQYGILLTGPGIAREGYEIFKNNDKIGIVTSGTMSPSLQKAIALISVKIVLNIGEEIEVQVRKNRVGAKVVPLPFLKDHAI